MAARRLIVILIVLLLVSTIAAALAPPIEEREADEAPAPPERADGPPAEARVLERRLDAGDRRPREISLAPGDRLVLIVTADELGEVRIRSLGLLAFAGPGSPARFDLLAREGRGFAVELEGETLARVTVSDGRAAMAGPASRPG